MAQVTKTEMEEINVLRNKLATVVSETGQITLQIQLLEADIKDLTGTLNMNTEAFKKLLQEEQALIKRLSEKYGTGNINFETGEFTPEK
jgi:chromosome segregation ATPase